MRPRDIFVWLVSRTFARDMLRGLHKIDTNGSISSWQDFLAFPQNNAVVWGGVDWTHPLETSEGPGGPSIFEKTIVVLDKEASIMSRLWVRSSLKQLRS